VRYHPLHPRTQTQQLLAFLATSKLLRILLQSLVFAQLYSSSAAPAQTQLTQWAVPALPVSEVNFRLAGDQANLPTRASQCVIDWVETEVGLAKLTCN
jgi:hypothetical protein